MLDKPYRVQLLGGYKYLGFAKSLLLRLRESARQTGMEWLNKIFILPDTRIEIYIRPGEDLIRICSKPKEYLLIFLASMCESIGILKLEIVLNNAGKGVKYKISPIKRDIKYDLSTNSYSFDGGSIEYASSWSNILTAQSNPSYSDHKIGVPPSEPDNVFGCFTTYYFPDITGYGAYRVFMIGVGVVILQVGFPDCYVPLINYSQIGGFQEGFAFTQTDPPSPITWKSYAPTSPKLPYSDSLLAYGRKHYEMNDELLSEINIGAYVRTPIIQGHWGNNTYFMLSWKGKNWKSKELTIKDELNKYERQRLVITTPRTINVVRVPGPYYEEGNCLWSSVTSTIDQVLNAEVTHDNGTTSSPLSIIATINDNVIYTRSKGDFTLTETPTSYPEAKRTIINSYPLYWWRVGLPDPEITHGSYTKINSAQFLLYKQHGITKDNSKLIVNDVTIREFNKTEDYKNDMCFSSADDSSIKTIIEYASHPPWWYTLAYGQSEITEEWEWSGFTEINGVQGIIKEYLSTTKGEQFVSVMDYDFLVGKDIYILFYQYDEVEKKRYEKWIDFYTIAFTAQGPAGALHGFCAPPITLEKTEESKTTRKRVLYYHINDISMAIEIPYEGETGSTGFSCYANKYNFLYTYLVPWESGGRKRILGVINISDKKLPIGFRQEWEINDDNNDDYFGKTYPNFPYKTLAAVGLNKGK